MFFAAKLIVQLQTFVPVKQVDVFVAAKLIVQLQIFVFFKQEDVFVAAKLILQLQRCLLLSQMRKKSCYCDAYVADAGTQAKLDMLRQPPMTANNNGWLLYIAQIFS